MPAPRAAANKNLDIISSQGLKFITSVLSEYLRELNVQVQKPVPSTLLFPLSHRQQAIEGIHVCLGTGHNDISGSAAPGIGHILALYSYQHLAYGLNPLRNRFDGELGEPVRYPDYAVDSLVYGTHGTRAQSSISQNLPFRADEPDCCRRNIMIAAGNFHMVEVVHLGDSTQFLGYHRLNVAVRDIPFLIG